MIVTKYNDRRIIDDQTYLLLGTLEMKFPSIVLRLSNYTSVKNRLESSRLKINIKIQ